MRRCRRCGWDLPESEFSPEPRRTDGLRPWCKECNAAHVRANTDPEQRREYDRRRKDQRNARLRRRRANDPAYAQAERDTCRVRHQLRQAGITLAQLIREERGLCYLCGTHVVGDGEPDHIVALVAGGTNVRENIGLAHVSCNRRKQRYPVASLAWAVPEAREREAVALMACGIIASAVE